LNKEVRHRLYMAGRVQGVGFRYFTMTVARRLGVGGWVSNELDGSVTCEVQGGANALLVFGREVRRGPRFARVDQVRTEELQPLDQRGVFEIR